MEWIPTYLRIVQPLVVTEPLEWNWVGWYDEMALTITVEVNCERFQLAHHLGHLVNRLGGTVDHVYTGTFETRQYMIIRGGAATKKLFEIWNDNGKQLPVWMRPKELDDLMLYRELVE